MPAARGGGRGRRRCAPARLRSTRRRRRGTGRTRSDQFGRQRRPPAQPRLRLVIRSSTAGRPRPGQQAGRPAARKSVRSRRRGRRRIEDRADRTRGGCARSVTSHACGDAVAGRDPGRRLSRGAERAAAQRSRALVRAAERRSEARGAEPAPRSAIRRTGNRADPARSPRPCGSCRGASGPPCPSAPRRSSRVHDRFARRMTIDARQPLLEARRRREMSSLPSTISSPSVAFAVGPERIQRSLTCRTEVGEVEEEGAIVTPGERGTVR